MKALKVIKLTGSLLLLLCCISFGISMKGVQPDAFIHYYKTHQEDFKKQQNNGVAIYNLAYLPKELLLIQAVKKQQLTYDEVDDWMKEKETDLTFLLQVSIPQNGTKEFLKFEKDTSTYEQRLMYYAFQFQNDLQLVKDNAEKLPIYSFHFERTYGSSPIGSFTFSCKKPKKWKEIQLIINDKTYGTTSVIMTFQGAKINELPTLLPINKWKK
jgi:hypothetical protein